MYVPQLTRIHQFLFSSYRVVCMFSKYWILTLSVDFPCCSWYSSSVSQFHGRLEWTGSSMASRRWLVTTHWPYGNSAGSSPLPSYVLWVLHWEIKCWLTLYSKFYLQWQTWQWSSARKLLHHIAVIHICDCKGWKNDVIPSISSLRFFKVDINKEKVLIILVPIILL